VTYGQRPAPRPIEDLVLEIEAASNSDDERFIANALLFREVRRRIEAGELGRGIKWLEWAREHFSLRRTALYKLNYVGGATDPKAALDEFRFRENQRQKTHRQRQEDGGDERDLLVALVRRLPLEKVMKLHNFAKAL